MEWLLTEPVGSTDGALDDIQERIHNPVGQPLSIIRGARTEQGLQRVITRDNETNDIDEERTGNVKEHQQDVGSNQSQDGVGLGNRRLLLQVVKDGVFGKLSRR